ncbi:MAG: DUF1700 domain-containing protein [Erysipelotrichaceae bacterium]|nr:DUF1700 domain-containing protein [Erysipelotrichaceae bacterium]
MTKEAFLNGLKKGLKGLPNNDIEEHIAFYDEMIEDKKEDGISEEEAILQIGSIDDVVKQILSETSFKKLVKEKIKKPSNLRVWEIVLLIIGSPLWITLLLCALTFILVLYVLIYTLLIVILAIVLSLFVSFIACAISMFITLFTGNFITSLLAFSFALISLGLFMLMLLFSKKAIKFTFVLTKKLTLLIKYSFIERG